MPETHSQRVLLGGEAGLGTRSPSAPRPQPCPLSQLGRTATRPLRTDGPKRASGGCIRQRECLLGQQSTAPTRLGSGQQRKPFSPPSPLLSRWHSGAGLPLAPWTLLLCWGSPVPETHSQRVLLGGEAGLGARRPSTPRPQPCPLSQLGCSAPRPRRTDGPKRASGGCILQRESLLRQPTTAPTRLGSGKQRKPFSPPALRSPEGKSVRGCPWLPGPCCFAGGLRCPKPTPHGISLAGKQDWGREGHLRPGRSHAP